jgi:hypothetical protein
MIDVRQTEFEQAALQALLQGDIADAARLIAQSKGEPGEVSGSPRPGSMGFPGLSPILVENAGYLLTLPYDDLLYAAEVRRLVGAQLALGVLLWERPEAIAMRLLGLTDGQFTCPSLDAFLRHNPPGKLWFYFNPNRPQDRAALYAQTRCVEAAAAVRLKRLLAARDATPRAFGPQGIAIRYAGGHQCAVCLQGRRHYRWSECDELPKLPRHWGCHCMYVAWEGEPERR